MGGGATKTKTTTDAGPPQLMPEGAAGYKEATDWYKGQMNQPSVYTGQREAQASPLQLSAFNQARNVLGGPDDTGPDYMKRAKGATADTLSGSWMTGPEAQTALSGMAQPLFERYENQTMPGIRDRTEFATRGGGGSRRTVAEHNALQELGQSYASGVAAPVFSGERERMTRTALESPTAFTNADVAGTAALAGLGEQYRQLASKPLQESQAQFEESLAREADSSQNLIAAATTGPGGSTAAYYPSMMRMILGAGKA